MLKLLSLGTSVIGGAILVGVVGSLTLKSDESSSHKIPSLVGKSSSEKRGCKILYVRSDVEETLSDDPSGEDSLKNKVIDEGSREKVIENCKNGKTVYMSFNDSGGKWVFFTSK